MQAFDAPETNFVQPCAWMRYEVLAESVLEGPISGQLAPHYSSFDVLVRQTSRTAVGLGSRPHGRL
jgi:hypothetical protein